MALNPAQFVQESWSELKKSTWLPRIAMIQSTIVVVLIVSVVAVYVASVDFVLSVVMRSLLGGR